MSPQDMQSASRCPATCPECVMARARRRMTLGWVAIVYGLVSIGVSWPVDGPLGAALALTGMAVLWRGWFLIVRRPGGDR